MNDDLSTLRGRLKTRLELVREELMDAVDRLKDGDLDWAPSEGMRTIGGQITEIVGTEIQIIGILRDGAHKEHDEIMAGIKRTTVDEYRSLLDEVRAETVSCINSLSDAELDSTVEMPKNWFEALRLDAVPRSEVIRSIAAHEWYHVGQLYSYLWMRGDNPYKW